MDMDIMIKENGKSHTEPVKLENKKYLKLFKKLHRKYGFN